MYLFVSFIDSSLEEKILKKKGEIIIITGHFGFTDAVVSL